MSPGSRAPWAPDDDQLGLMLQASLRRGGPAVHTDLDAFGVRVYAASRRARRRRRAVVGGLLLAGVVAVALLVAQVGGDPVAPLPGWTPTAPGAPRSPR